MKAFVFPGQGSQFSGMGKDFYEKSDLAKKLFNEANSILEFDIAKVMFEGSNEDLKQTKITQPAVFLHSVIMAKMLDNITPDMVAGHSLGEFSALVTNKTISFEDGLSLVYKRALAMQKACEIKPSTMAAILGMSDNDVEKLCDDVKEGIVVPANYNSPGQLVISGDIDAVNRACELAKERGAKRAVLLPVGGAFHSPLMESARETLAIAIENTKFNTPICPIYQNVNAKPTNIPNNIKNNLITQLTSPVRWTQSVEQMINNGAKEFIELGPGNVLQGLISKINKDVSVSSF